MQSVSSLRTTAFQGSQLRTSSVRSCVCARSPVVVKAVQDVKGVVVSTAMNKTVVVAVERLAPHDKYFKRIRQTKRFLAHDESATCGLGDYVLLEGCRPLSKNKRFTVAQVIRKSDGSTLAQSKDSK